MNQHQWRSELADTPLWLLQSTALSICLIALAVWLLRRTRFGRQFGAVVRPCLASGSRIKAWALLAFLLFMILAEVRISVLNTFFYNGLYSALQDKAIDAFWFFALINAALMLVKIGHAIVDDFLEQVLVINWFERLNRLLTDAWLTPPAYYQLQIGQTAPDNIDQRIQQDAQEFTTSTAIMLRGLLHAIVSIIEFTLILWGLAGVLHLLGLHIPRGMVMFIYLFILTATALSVWIGRPLVHLNFHNERYSGNYRYALVRIRDHAESIAFYRGETAEQRNLARHFGQLIRNRWQIAYRSVALNGFNTGITQISALLPLMLQAPRFFAGEVKIGDMHQTVQAFNRLQRALSFFRNAYEDFTAYRARLERLAGLIASIQTQQTLPQTQRRIATDSGYLKLQNLSLHHPDGSILVSDFNLTAHAGQSILIQGQSGCGKTSLLRVLAGLWPFGSSGRIQLPAGEILFLPQRPYMPQGTLAQTLCYPSHHFDDPTLQAALHACQLPQLIPLLHDERDWQHILSPGQLQRIAFARVLLQRPQLILLDEATAALDETTETELYQLIRRELPQAIIISIGHRCTLHALHDHHIQLHSSHNG